MQGLPKIIQSHRWLRPACFVALFYLAMWQAMYAAPADPRGTRARPPKWTRAVQDVFFPDAREKLIDDRPNYGSGGSVAGVPRATPASVPAVTVEGPAAGGGTKWSQIISAESIENEIKVLYQLLAENLTSLGEFKGDGFKQSRRHFSELALLFAIIADYDGDVRWKDIAPSVRDSMARAGFNCKVATDASYNEAKLRRDDLEQLVQGGRPSLPPAESRARWDKVTNRPPLMQRLEVAQQQRIAVWTANNAEFKKNAEGLLREAELAAAIGHVIAQEGFEFGDDDTYVGYAHQMRDTALEIVGAVKGGNYDAAQSASANIKKVCTGCHDRYRS